MSPVQEPFTREQAVTLLNSNAIECVYRLSNFEALAPLILAVAWRVSIFLAAVWVVLGWVESA
jgi:hypothetical protein